MEKYLWGTPISEFTNSYYKMILECRNCSKENTIFILKGVFVKDIIKDLTCCLCECNSLRSLK